MRNDLRNIPGNILLLEAFLAVPCSDICVFLIEGSCTCQRNSLHRTVHGQDERLGRCTYPQMITVIEYIHKGIRISPAKHFKDQSQSESIVPLYYFDTAG